MQQIYSLQENTHAEVRFQIKLQTNFIEIAPSRGRSRDYFLHIFRTPSS